MQRERASLVQLKRHVRNAAIMTAHWLDNYSLVEGTAKTRVHAISMQADIRLHIRQIEERFAVVESRMAALSAYCAENRV